MNFYFRGFVTENGTTSAVFLRDNDPDPSPPVRGKKSFKRKLFSGDDNSSKPEDNNEGSKEKNKVEEGTENASDNKRSKPEDSSECSNVKDGEDNIVEVTEDRSDNRSKQEERSEDSKKKDEVVDANAFVTEDTSDNKTQSHSSSPLDAEDYYKSHCHLKSVDKAQKSVASFVTGSESDKKDLCQNSSPLDEEDYFMTNCNVVKAVSKKVDTPQEADVRADDLDNDPVEPEKSKLQEEMVELERPADTISEGVQENFYELQTESDEEYDQVLVTIENESDDEVPEDLKLNMISNRNRRYLERNDLVGVVKLHDKEGNKEFIIEFEEDIKKGSASGSKDKRSTVPATTSLLFRHSDSFLSFETSKNPNFRLDMLVSFQDESKLVQLKDPGEWIAQIEGEDGRALPIRRNEMYKSYLRLVEFVNKKFQQTDFGSDTASLYRQDKLGKNLEKLPDNIAKSGVWRKLKVLINADKKLRDAAREVLAPESNYNEMNLNKVYLQSEQFKSRLENFNQIWTKANDTGEIESKDFNTVSNLARHIACFHDRSRQAAYSSMSNADFGRRKKIWFPPNHNKDSFDGLKVPDGWNLYKEPCGEVKREHDLLLVPILGSSFGAKLNEDNDLIFIGVAEELVLKFLDIKRIRFKDEYPQGNDHFFCSFHNKPLSAIKNSKGSILEEVEKVVGVSKCTATSYRRSMQQKIEEDPLLKSSQKIVGQHSSKTATKFYNKNKGAFRASAIHYIAETEGIAKKRPFSRSCDKDNEEELMKKRSKLDEEEKSSTIEHAKQILKKNPGIRNVGEGKFSPSHRDYLQTSFSKGGCFADLKFYDGKFPGKIFST